METKRMNPIKNQSGSALPFVIILGLVLLVLVASLATVATSTISFTQESVESRQAYLDAKAVTEYGKVLIENKITEMQSATLENKTTANSDGDVIFYIKGVRSNPLNPLTLTKMDASASPTDTAIIGIGKLSWKQTQITGDAKNGTATTTYTISVESTNLARKLDYKQTFDYELTTTTTGTGTYPPPPGQPTAPTVIPTQFGTQTGILINKNNLLECQVTGEGYGIENAKEKNGILDVVPRDSQYSLCNINLKSFSFKGTTTLNISANQIAVSTDMPSVWKPTYNFGDRTKTQLLYFANGYKPDKGGNHDSTNTLKAKNIIINGDLNLMDSSILDIDCDNLWITGNVTLATKNNTITNKIKAKNIVIGGNLYLDHYTKLTIDCPNVWLGSLSSGSTTPELTLNNVQYFKAGTMNLNDKMKLTITGDPSSQTNQVEVGSLDTTSTGQQININGLYSFNCLGNITQSWSGATINIQAKVVTIGGNLSLTGIKADDFKILTQYFVCKGNVLLQQINGTFYIGDAVNQTSGVKFEKDYTQIDSIVGLYGGKNVAFNGNVTLGNWGNRQLTIASDNIYFKSNSINTQNNTVICKGVTTVSLANVLLQTQTANPVVAAGKYVGFTTNALSDATLVPGNFDEITFPPQPGAGGSGEITTTTSSVDVGQSNYY